ncbi:MAG: hypothetical protein ABIH88_02565 [Patescibacteria group bacterium]|nr:hypothetical protein [Patescibacteria group bacterium]
MSVEGGSRGVVRFWRLNEPFRCLVGERNEDTGEYVFPPRSIPLIKDRQNGNNSSAEQEGDNGVVIFSAKELVSSERS